MERDWIEEGLYRMIRENIPIASVDALTVCRGKLLLLLRNNEPAKGLWWTPGGRVKKGEQLGEAVRRDLKEETGLSPYCIEKIGVMSHIWPKVHFVTSFFRVEVDDDSVVLNEEHSDYRWISSVNDELHPFLVQMIEESNIFQARVSDSREEI